MSTLQLVRFLNHLLNLSFSILAQYPFVSKEFYSLCYLFFSDFIASEDFVRLLRSEIQNEGEYLSLQVHVIDADSRETLAVTAINLWVMLEDSCNIVMLVMYLLLILIAFSDSNLFSLISCLFSL